MAASRLVVETGAGTPGANGYCTRDFVTSYLQARQRETEAGWIDAAADLQDGAIISATSFIEARWGPLINGTPLRPLIIGRVAEGTFDLAAGNPADGQTFTLGAVVYRFKTALVQENDVLIGVDEEATIANLWAAIVGESTGLGVLYHVRTRPNLQATAAVDEDDPASLILSAFVEGENGNTIPLATNATGAAVSGATLAGGIDTAPQPLSFPKVGLYTRRGELVVGVPLKAKQATAEYAVRALAAALSVDPTVSTTGALIKSLRERVGPIEEETVFVDGGQVQAWRNYPAADALLADYVSTGGRSYR